LTLATAGTQVIRIVQFSDSLVAFTKDCSDISSLAIRLASLKLFNQGLSLSLPLRGAIARGPVTADFRRMIFFAQTVVDAYELEEAQQWYGIAEHESCDPQERM